MVTTPAEEMRRIVRFAVSTTNKLPLVSIAIPWGKPKRACVPTPSELLESELPAKVVNVNAAEVEAWAEAGKASPCQASHTATLAQIG